MAKEKETTVEQVEEQIKEEPKKAAPKKVAPKVDRKAFIERKLKAINAMQNEALARRQANRLKARR